MKQWKRWLRAGILLAGITAATTVSALAGNVVITIDAGHGGADYGAIEQDGAAVEKVLNLSIAKALKAELNTYEGVTVYMTRTGDATLSLDERVAIAKKNKSHLLISVHNNAKGDAQSYTNGSSALVSSGQYYADLANCTQNLGGMILSQLHESTGLTNHGLLKRLSASSRYPNGKKADYYGLIRMGTQAGVPSMIVEHAFVDSATDYKNYLNTTAKRTKLGIADATAIAKYFGLKKKNGTVSYTAVGKPVRMMGTYWLCKGDRYYYVQKNGTYLTGWQTINGSTYRLGSDGAAATGLHTYTSGSRAGTYYFNERGKMMTGWQQIDGEWYYFRKTGGKAVTDATKTIDGTSYTFNANGVCRNR